MSHEYNFHSPKLSQEDLLLFLGPFEPTDGDFIPIEDDNMSLMAHLLAKIGLFKSVGEAKKNGWNIPIPVGYSEYTVGKRKTKLFILTSFD